MVTITLTDEHAAALRFVGLRADDVYGTLLGRVEAILVDRERGSVQWLHVRLSGAPDAYLALPLRDLRAGAGHLHFPHDRELLLTAPRVPESGALTSRLERQLCEFFGITAKTRGAGVSAWERRATSARLVAPGVWEPTPRGPASSVRGRVTEAPARPLVVRAAAPAPRVQPAASLH